MQAFNSKGDIDKQVQKFPVYSSLGKINLQGEAICIGKREREQFDDQTRTQKIFDGKIREDSVMGKLGSLPPKRIKQEKQDYGGCQFLNQENIEGQIALNLDPCISQNQPHPTPAKFNTFSETRSLTSDKSMLMEPYKDIMIHRPQNSENDSVQMHQPILMKQEKSSEIKEPAKKDADHVFLNHIKTEEERRSMLPTCAINQKFRAYGSAQEYKDRFKQLVKHFLTLKYMEKKEELLIAPDSMQPQNSNEKARLLCPAEKEGTINTGKQKNINYIAATVQDTAHRNGLTIKDANQIYALIGQQLGETIHVIVEKVKNYLEDEVHIQWQEFEQYHPGLSNEQKVEHDWKIFVMFLKAQSIRYALVDKPDLFSDPKLTAFLRENLI